MATSVRQSSKTIKNNGILDHVLTYIFVMSQRFCKRNVQQTNLNSEAVLGEQITTTGNGQQSNRLLSFQAHWEQFRGSDSHPRTLWYVDSRRHNSKHQLLHHWQLTEPSYRWSHPGPDLPVVQWCSRIYHTPGFQSGGMEGAPGLVGRVAGKRRPGPFLPDGCRSRGPWT